MGSYVCHVDCEFMKYYKLQPTILVICGLDVSENGELTPNMWPLLLPDQPTCLGLD